MVTPKFSYKIVIGIPDIIYESGVAGSLGLIRLSMKYLEGAKNPTPLPPLEYSLAGQLNPANVPVGAGS